MIVQCEQATRVKRVGFVLVDRWPHIKKKLPRVSTTLSQPAVWLSEIRRKGKKLGRYGWVRCRYLPLHHSPGITNARAYHGRHGCYGCYDRTVRRRKVVSRATTPTSFSPLQEAFCWSGLRPAPSRRPISVFLVNTHHLSQCLHHEHPDSSPGSWPPSPGPPPKRRSEQRRDGLAR